MRLNEKFRKEGLDHNNLREITTKYNSDYRKHRYKLAEETKKQWNRIFRDKKLAIKVIMDCRTTLAYKIRARLRFRQNDVISTKEQSVLTKIMSLFERNNMQTQCNVLGCRIDLYFHDYQLEIETDENGRSDRIIV